jgi:YVTN family beta-propeller protein
MHRRIKMLSFLLAATCLSVAANAQRVIATIPIANFAGGGAVDPLAKLAYIPTYTSNDGVSQVTVVNERTQTIAGYINLSTSSAATSAALNYKTGLLYVGAQNGGLFVVDPKTGATVAFVNVNAVSVAVDSVTNKIYASDFDETLSVVDGASNMIDTTITIPGILQNIAVNPFTNRIYAVNQNNPGILDVVDGKTNQLIAEPNAASGVSTGVAVDPFRNIIYSADPNFLSTSGTGTVSVFNGRTNTLVASTTLEGTPAAVVEDPLTFTVYASSYSNNTVYVIDGANHALIDSITVGSQPQYLTDDPINKLLYVGCQSPDGTTFILYVIKTR